MDHNNNIAQLKDSGLKVTGPRLKILDLFEQRPEAHLSAEDVYRLLLEDESDIGVATIYRVLTQFEQAEILIRHHFETGKAVYELNRGGHHDHIVCVKCNQVTEFFDSRIEEIQEQSPEPIQPKHIEQDMQEVKMSEHISKQRPRTEEQKFRRSR